MTITNIEISVDNNHKMAAALWLPKQYKAAVVIAHSWRNSMNKPMCLDAAKFFYSKGIVALQICLPGHNEWEKQRELSLSLCAQYSKAAVNYLRENTTAKGIVGFGISLGSMTIGCSEKGLYDTQVLVSFMPLVDPKKIYSRYAAEIKQKKDFLEKNEYVILKSSTGRADFEMGKEFIDELFHGQSPETYFENKVPTLLVQGTSDSRYDQKAIDEFTEKSNATSFIVEGADHNVSDQRHRKIILQKSYEFLKKHLDL